MAAAHATDDKRRTGRKATSATLTFVPFTTRKVSAVAVRVRDCNAHGLNFVASHPLKTGQTICLHTPACGDPAPSQTTGPHLKSFALAEVRWCRKAAGQEDTYLVGVRYL